MATVRRWVGVGGLVGALAGCDPAIEEGPQEVSQDLVDDHQVVQLRLHDSAQPRLSGTTSLQAIVYYTECLSRFYRDQPQWGYDGDEGKPVFDFAADEGLCIGPFFEEVDCDVRGIRQDLYGDDKLRVDFDIFGPLDDRVLRLGPLPDPALAGCDEEGQPPFVGHVSLTGFDALGQSVWVSSSQALVPAYQDAPADVSVTAP